MGVPSLPCWEGGVRPSTSSRVNQQNKTSGVLRFASVTEVKHTSRQSAGHTATLLSPFEATGRAPSLARA